MTVRFTYRNQKIRIIGARYWPRGGKYMKNKDIKYSDEPLGEIELISDFLPSPDKLDCI